MNILLPKHVNYIINKLYDNGYEAYAVGGCVRDSILGKEPKDWDITTSASPYEVKELFDRTIDTGLKHGTITVMLEHIGYEVTTYRIDGEYKDSRHPENVIFTSDLMEDLKRRDFTINAMAYNEREGLKDFSGGKEDLEKKIIRCVGDALERFEEDALRILRAIRFSAQLGFEIHEDTIKAIKEKRDNLSNISAERIKVELDKILLSNNPDRLIKAYEYGITQVILPEFDVMMKTEQENPNHMYNVGVHTINSLYNINDILRDNDNSIDSTDKLMLKWTMLLHDVGKPVVKTFDENNIAHFKTHEKVGSKMAGEIFKRLKFDRYTSDKAKALINVHDYRCAQTHKSVRKAVNYIGKELMDYLFIIKRADIMAQNTDTINDKLKDLDNIIEIYRDIIAKEQCVSMKELALNGNDLKELGISEGKKIGEILKYLLDEVIENPDSNNKDFLLELVKKDGKN